MVIPILAYHKVQNEFDLTATRISPVQFERQIKYLSESGFKTISINEYLNKKCNVTNGIIITFDDAYESIFKTALPILTKYNFTATIFVITNFVGSLNSWDYVISKFRSAHCDWGQLRQLCQQGWEVGSHSKSHRNLRILNNYDLAKELRESKLILEDKLEQCVNVISYPYGRFDDRVIAFAAHTGYKAACTLGGYRRLGKTLSPFRLPRRGVYLFEPLRLFKYKVKNSKWTRYDDIQQKVITVCATGAIVIRHMKAV